MASGSGLCKTTSNFIWGQLLLLGEGIPDPGDIFNTGSSLFKQISDKMGLAIPGTNWIGQAAEAYLNQNIAQQLRAQVMGDLDKLTGNMISNQAKYVSDTRDVLRAMKKMIDGVYKVCKGLEKIPLLGHLWSWELAIPMSGIAMAVVGGALLYLTIMTLMNATNLRGILGRLIEMLTTLPKFPGLPGLPSIPNLFPGLPGLGDLLPGVGDLGKLPTWTELAALPDFLGGFAGLPSLGFGNLLSFASLPTVGQVTATMGQLQQLVAAGGGPSQLASMGSQQAQLISSQAQQGGQQHATLVSDKKEDEEGAAAGVAEAERAPIDAGTAASQRGQEGTVL
ncbi:secretion protein EspE [Mycobacterium tuberculosis variant bovis]|uniref:EspA/EspE family type VII secretion system effector n=1 Tax=Mycobacterium tuberculosis TaxID=1773 RepID=UPI0003A98A7D|nr:EspA/EspE family type VII secretion system effector [Mycobacterium tuberculosis]MCN4171846.1 secretion protein EspE [Mycobacterium tuberculosis]PHO97691.1 secretion protein EspE [Mycobacterium tuberculosis variant bovis]